ENTSHQIERMGTITARKLTLIEPQNAKGTEGDRPEGEESAKGDAPGQELCTGAHGDELFFQQMQHCRKSPTDLAFSARFFTKKTRTFGQLRQGGDQRAEFPLAIRSIGKQPPH